MSVDLYRNRDFIPDFDEIAAETAARSQALAARVELRRDIAYGASPRMRMDLLLPAALRRGAPLHVFFHGGYWRSGRKEDHHLVAAPVLAAGGICAVVTYELMPCTRLGTIVGQARTAAHHALREGLALGADPNRVSASGHSAGAHLASYLAAQGPGEIAPPAPLPLTGLLLVSGLYDLSGIPGSFLKTEAQMTEAEARAWSPLTSRQSPAPLRHITRGALETQPFHDQARAFGDKLREGGAGVELAEEPDHNHLSVVLALADPNTCLGARLSAMVAG